MSSINVIFASDKNFIPYVATALVSMAMNYRGEKTLDVYLLTDKSLQEKDISVVQGIGKDKRFPFNLQIVQTDGDAYQGLKTTSGISVATYYRFHMHELLPKIDRALYFDGDIIVKGDIGEIYDFPMDGLLFRGVEDSISIHYKEKFHSPMDWPHINAGVMLCNLKLMREMDISNQIGKFIRKFGYKIVLGDQQIINELFHSEIGPLPIKWNVHGDMFTSEWMKTKFGVMNTMDLTEVEEAIASPALIHYTCKRKPWMSLEHPWAKEWYKYNGMTPFAHKLPSKQSKITRKIKNGFTLLKRIRSLDGIYAQIQGIARTLSSYTVKRRGINVNPQEELRLNDAVRESLHKYILTSLANKVTDRPFHAREIIERIPENSPILCNALKKDLDGFNQNIKGILKTLNISRTCMHDAKLSLITVQRMHLPEYWNTINASYFYDIPYLFCETSFFAGFAAYFDKTAGDYARRGFGYIFDDMGPYFDARQPSRLEKTLNDPNYKPTVEELERAKNLIELVVRKRYTKYNRYVSAEPSYSDIPDDAIVVIDQKRGDASIDYARADDHSFDCMVRCALSENPSQTVFIKAHPDNLHLGAASKFQEILQHSRIRLVDSSVSAPDLLDKARKVYVVSSQMGFEAVLRKKTVIVFGLPFYSGWGLTDDRSPIPRRIQRRSIEEIFHVACIRNSVYFDPSLGSIVEIEDMFRQIDILRSMDPFSANQRHH